MATCEICQCESRRPVMVPVMVRSPEIDPDKGFVQQLGAIGESHYRGVMTCGRQDCMDKAKATGDRRAHSDTEPQQPAELRREDLYRAGWTYRPNAKGEIELQAPETKPTSGGSGGAGGSITVTIGGSSMKIIADPTVPKDRPRVFVQDPKFVDGHRTWSNMAPTPQTAAQPATSTPTDPLDVKYDGVTLRELLAKDEKHRREERRWCMKDPGDSVEKIYRHYYPDEFEPTPAQRAAISAHWSSELRARVDVAKQKEREQVVSEYDEDRP